MAGFPRFLIRRWSVPPAIAARLASWPRTKRRLPRFKAKFVSRLAKTERKEVVVFIHGYNNTFNDAANATGSICRLLGGDFVCVVLTWPAGGSRGAFLGYNVDRESGEFAVADMRKAIRAIGQTEGVRGVHIIAHSRGTDVLASAFQQLSAEAYVSRFSITENLKVRNIVLFAPDIDIDVAATKIFDVFSDPDAPYGAKKNPNAAIRQGSFHLTIYSSPGDQALGLSSSIFGSRLRLGQLDLSGPEARALRADPGHLVDLIEVDENTGAFGGTDTSCRTRQSVPTWSL